MTDLWLSVVFFQALNTPKLVFGRGSAPDPSGELTTLGRGCLPFPLDAFGVDLGASVVRPPTQIPGYAYGRIIIRGLCEVSTRPEVRCTRCGWARG